MRRSLLGSSTTLILLLAADMSRAQDYYGKFVDLPIALENRTDASPKPFRITKALNFNDPNGLLWSVPAGSYTDGATIPWLFELIVGDNYDGPYFPASIVHDYFCCVQTRTAHDTHRNFYYAMLANGTPSWQAWLMYSAVRLGGPDWTLTQQSLANDGTNCFDEIGSLLTPPRGAGASTAAAPSAETSSPSRKFDIFIKSAALAQDQRDTFLVSKLMAVAKTLQDTDGKVIDLTATGEIPATFEGVEQLKAMVDGATTFAGYSPTEARANFTDFGLLVPIEGSSEQVVASVKAEGGLVRTGGGWSAVELSNIGIAQATLPKMLPDSYLVEAARTNGLKGTGIEWTATKSVAERAQWNKIIEADRSYQNWLTSPNVLPQGG
ncbi:DUF1353 domain-containing protein [Aminobacter aminovorans]|nr:DUF1353 domain-containing protein [Aminobacter aminovorans]